MTSRLVERISCHQRWTWSQLLVGELSFVEFCACLLQANRLPVFFLTSFIVAKAYSYLQLFARMYGPILSSSCFMRTMMDTELCSNSWCGSKVPWLWQPSHLFVAPAIRTACGELWCQRNWQFGIRAPRRRMCWPTKVVDATNFADKLRPEMLPILKAKHPAWGFL